ncbi:tripartite tricarboxylate transporter substrate binding protein [uncultured Ramlibacter sp.]|uniref:tripartite tricarboxylate transporter substrate binding protein n=1 Tax=uncultured Ramlibacter sp. TaxID=260755 RepID=UPI002602E1A8|nr:tripartite tricarboxylate transporter substrate binding protein [uncultured Ramlibacter sp.]
MLSLFQRLAAGLSCILLSLGASAQVPQAAAAQAPLRLIVPFTPGTGIDLIARTLGPRLGERLGRPVVVDNRAGASGNIGTEAVVRAAPNGATLLVSVNTLVINRSLYPGLPFDPVKDLVPVSLTSWGQLLLVARPQSGYSDAAALVAAAKKQPGTLNYASPGVGTPHHLAMELFKATNAIFITHIPYRGSAQAVSDLLGGQVDTMFLPIHVALSHVRSGRLLALGVGSDKRHPLLPQVPTLAEARAGNVNVAMWYGVFAPPGSAPDFVAQLNRELQGILALPEVRSAFETQGMDPAGSSPEEFRRLVEQDAGRWERLIKAQGITAD